MKPSKPDPAEDPPTLPKAIDPCEVKGTIKPMCRPGWDTSEEGKK